MRRTLSSVLSLTMLGALAPAASVAAAPAEPSVTLSEIRIDQPDSDDDEFFELAAPPGTSLDDLTYLVIGDGTGGSGVIENVTSLAGASVGEAGVFVAAEDTFGWPTADLVTTLNFENSDNVTHLVVAGFGGESGQDLDTDDDGTLDVTPWTSVLDSVALVETSGDPAEEKVYSETTVGPNGSFVPAHVYVCDGWKVGGFSTPADESPGSADNCAPTPPPAPPVVTIPEIQGDGSASPYEGDRVTTSGVVSLVVYRGFYLQDPAGDADRSTSDAIYVDSFKPWEDGITEGDVLRVTATVEESFGSTELDDIEFEETGTAPVPTPTLVNESLAASQGPDQAYYESLEHMRVELAVGYAYVGSNKFSESFLVPGDEDERVRRTDERYDLFAIGNAEEYPDGLPTYAGDVVRGAVGPLDYTFDNYKLMIEDADAATVTSAETAVPQSVELETDTDLLTFGTWNVENVFPVQAENDDLGLDQVDQSDVDAKRTKLGLAIADWLHAPDVLAVQEVANVELLQDIADEVNGLTGTTDYVGVLEEGNDQRKIDVGFLIDRNAVDGFANVRQIDADAKGDVCAAGAEDDLKHDRVPLAVDVTDNGRTITFVSVHLKSKFGGSEANDFWEDCRVEQAQSVVDAVGDLRDLVVLGDVNAFRDSRTLDVFEDAGLTNVVNEIPEDRRHSYAFSGRVQFLDHVLVSPALTSAVELVDSPKIVTDVPVQILSDDTTTGLGSSDHDPILVQLETRSASPGNGGSTPPPAKGDDDVESDDEGVEVEDDDESPEGTAPLSKVSFDRAGEFTLTSGKDLPEGPSGQTLFPLLDGEPLPSCATADAPCVRASGNDTLTIVTGGPLTIEVVALDDACPAVLTDTELTGFASIHRDVVGCADWWSLVEGYEDGDFGGAEQLKRMQAATVLKELLVEADVTLPDNPRDRTPDYDGVHDRALNQLIELGVMSGYADGTSGATAPITRGQFATMLDATLALAMGDAYPTDAPDAFGDDEGDPHEGALDRLASLGIVTGDEDGDAAASETIERQHAAAMVARALGVWFSATA